MRILLLLPHPNLLPSDPFDKEPLMPDRRYPELLAPAGTLRKCKVALAYGADAVYAGAAGFSMRPDDASLSPRDLREAARLAHEAGAALHVALNTLCFPDDLGAIREWFEETRDIPFDALILSDPAVLQMAQRLRPTLPLHLSTQQSVSNPDAAAFWRDAGLCRIVAARECTLADIRRMAEVVDMELFIHGSMCMAVSGRCLLSAYLTGASASRGACKHACRWEWQLVEEKRPGETFPLFQTGRETILLGSTDLCLRPYIREVLEAGAVAWKIEGRMKSEYYVGVTTAVYRQALDAIQTLAAGDGSGSDAGWESLLESVSHRPYAPGFAFGYADPPALQTDNRVRATHAFLGVVEEAQAGGSWLVARNPFRVGDRVEALAPGQAPFPVRIERITDDAGTLREAAHPGVLLDVRTDPPLPVFALLRRAFHPVDEG